MSDNKKCHCGEDAIGDSSNPIEELRWLCRPHFIEACKRDMNHCVELYSKMGARNMLHRANYFRTMLEIAEDGKDITQETLDEYEERLHGNQQMQSMR